MRSMEPQEVSVVVPTYNRSDFLKELLLALASQEFPRERFEVVVVVDGSTDETGGMLRDAQLPYSLRVFHRQRRGVAAARNYGAQAARGEVVLFLDDDVIPGPGLIAEHMRFHLQDPRAVVLGRLLPNARARRHAWSRWEEAMLEKHYQAIQNGRRPPGGRRLYSGNFSVRKQDLLRLGGFDENLKRAEDIDLGYRLEADGVRFHFNAAAEVVHRGYKSFDSWSRIPAQYGQCDVIMARDKGYPGMMAEVFGWYHQRNLLVRLLIRACMGRSLVSRSAVLAMRSAAAIAGNARLSVVSRYAYSAIYNLLYWQGVADELGGAEAFWSGVEQHRPVVGEGRKHRRKA